MNRRQFAGVVASTLAVPAMAARAATGEDLKFQPMHTGRRPEIGMLLYPGLTLMDLLGPLRSSAYLAVKRSEAAHFAHSTDPYYECYEHFTKI